MIIRLALPRSLRGRLLLTATLTLIAFLGLAGVALDRVFVNSAWVAERNQLRTQIMVLLAVIEIDKQGGIFIPSKLPEARLNYPDSELYATILNDRGSIIWRSHSSLGRHFIDLSVRTPGVENFRRAENQLDSPFYMEFGIAWEFSKDESRELTLVMVHTNREFKELVNSYRKDLFFWLGGAGVLLLLVQSLTLHWGLRPLSRVVTELDKVERAEQEHVRGVYPLEIAQLSRRINLFIMNERNHQKRYRNTLSDLAHSLKTPLAVLRSAAEDNKPNIAEEITEQVDRMTKIVDYQLNRSASSDGSVIHAAHPIPVVIDKIVASLRKVYASKEIRILSRVDPDSVFYGDEGDLYELLGNCLDNACKWAQKSVYVVVNSLEEEGMVHVGVDMRIEDDGPGIPVKVRRQVLERWARADERTHGHGIGLAVVKEITMRYSGELYIDESQYGGASIRIIFPCR